MSSGSWCGLSNTCGRWRRTVSTASPIEGENVRGVTWLVIEEVKSGDWGIAGGALTTEAAKVLAAGQPQPSMASG